MVKVDEYLVFPSLYVPKFQKVDIIVPCDDTPLWSSADSNKGDLE